MKPIAKSVCDFFDLKGMKYTVLNDEAGLTKTHLNIVCFTHKCFATAIVWPMLF